MPHPHYNSLSLQKHMSPPPVCWPNHHWTSGKQNSCFMKLKLHKKIESSRNRSFELSFTRAVQWAAMRELGGFALEMLLAFLSVGLPSMTGIISMIAALQFCGLRCESRVLARIYCPPILLHRPTSALCPSSLCCKWLLPGPHCSIFLPFPCYHYYFFLLSALRSKCFISLSLLECQKKQRHILPALWLTSQVGRYFLTTSFIHILSYHWTITVRKWLAKCFTSKIPWEWIHCEQIASKSTHIFIHNIKVLSCLFPNLISFVSMISLFDPILSSCQNYIFEI